VIVFSVDPLGITMNIIPYIKAHWHMHFECVFHFPRCNLR